MAYKRKTYKKRNPYGGSRRFRNYYKGGMQLYKDVMLLKSLVNVEKKFIDVSSAGVTLPTNTTGSLVLLNGIDAGGTQVQRTGNSIKMTSIKMEGFVQLSSLATNDYVTVSLVLDKQPNATTANWNDIYEIGSASSALAQRNKLTVDRFVVLKKWDLPLATAGDTIRKFVCYEKINLHEKFNGNGATIASIYTNAIYLVFSGNLSANYSNITYYSRIRFVDN